MKRERTDTRMDKAKAPCQEGRTLPKAEVGHLGRRLETSQCAMWMETLSQADPDYKEGGSTGGSELLTKFCGIWSSILGKELDP